MNAGCMYGWMDRYWAGLIAKAFAEIQDQCTHDIENEYIGLENIIVCGKGLKLRVGGLRFLNQVSVMRSRVILIQVRPSRY